MLQRPTAKQIKISTASKDLVHFILVNPKEELGIRTVNVMPRHGAHFKSIRRESPFKITVLEKLF